MSIRKFFFLFYATLLPAQIVCTASLAEEFKASGYKEIQNAPLPEGAFDWLYDSFDELIAWLQANPSGRQKLYNAKERFIRTKERNDYSTDFFGFFDESEREGRHQISFYYSTRFHDYLFSRHPEFNHLPQIRDFFNICLQIQESYGSLFDNAAVDLGIETIVAGGNGKSPLILKVIKYLPAYAAARPHYDGTMLSFFLDSTRNESLLLSSYKNSYGIADFVSPQRTHPRGHSVILIPGALLTEISVYPTPHIVKHTGTIRYAAIAFMMRPDYTPRKVDLAPLPFFKD